MRLIDADALLKAMEEERQFLLARGQTGAEHILVHHCLPIIDNAPTIIWCSETSEGHPLIDLRPREKGEWSDESKDSLLCSACGKRVYKPFIGGFPTERTSHYYPNFCAFCGADMRGAE